MYFSLVMAKRQQTRVYKTQHTHTSTEKKKKKIQLPSGSMRKYHIKGKTIKETAADDQSKQSTKHNGRSKLQPKVQQCCP